MPSTSGKIRFLARILINKPLLTTFVFVLCEMSTLHDYAIRCRMCFVTDVWHESLQKTLEMARRGYFYKMEMVITSYNLFIIIPFISVWLGFFNEIKYGRFNKTMHGHCNQNLSYSITYLENKLGLIMTVCVRSKLKCYYRASLSVMLSNGSTQCENEIKCI